MNGNLHRNHGDFTGFSLFHVVMLPSHYPQCQDAMTEVKTNLGSDLYTQGWLARHVAWISSPHLSKCPNGTYMNLYWLGHEKWETQCSKVPGAFWVDSPIICHKKINLHLSSTTTSGDFPPKPTASCSLATPPTTKFAWGEAQHGIFHQKIAILLMATFPLQNLHQNLQVIFM